MKAEVKTTRFRLRVGGRTIRGDKKAVATLRDRHRVVVVKSSREVLGPSQRGNDYTLVSPEDVTSAGPPLPAKTIPT